MHFPNGIILNRQNVRDYVFLSSPFLFSHTPLRPLSTLLHLFGIHIASHSSSSTHMFDNQNVCFHHVCDVPRPLTRQRWALCEMEKEKKEKGEEVEREARWKWRNMVKPKVSLPHSLHCIVFYTMQSKYTRKVFILHKYHWKWIFLYIWRG